jgi:hypothetical protein
VVTTVPVPKTIEDRARQDSIREERRLSQRQLVEWSLLACPNDLRPRKRG